MRNESAKHSGKSAFQDVLTEETRKTKSPEGQGVIEYQLGRMDEDRLDDEL